MKKIHIFWTQNIFGMPFLRTHILGKKSVLMPIDIFILDLNSAINMKQKCTKLIYIKVVFPIDCQVLFKQLV